MSIWHWHWMDPQQRERKLFKEEERNSLCVCNIIIVWESQAVGHTQHMHACDCVALPLYNRFPNQPSHSIHLVISSIGGDNEHTITTQPTSQLHSYYVGMIYRVCTPVSVTIHVAWRYSANARATIFQVHGWQKKWKPMRDHNVRSYVALFFYHSLSYTMCIASIYDIHTYNCNRFGRAPAGSTVDSSPSVLYKRIVNMHGRHAHKQTMQSQLQAWYDNIK